MAGARINLRTIVSDILDEFKGAKALDGSTTTRGNGVWSKRGSQTTVATVNGGVVRATSGTGNTPYVLNTGRPNFSIGYTLAAVLTPTVINTPVWRVDAAGESWYTILHRAMAATPEYVIAWRGTSGSYNQLMNTGVVPKAGDKVRVDVQADTVSLYVNGRFIGGATMVTNPTDYNAGLMVNGADTATAFADYAIYLR